MRRVVEMKRWTCLLAGTAALSVACGGARPGPAEPSTGPAPGQAAAPSGDAEALFADLEARLLAAESVRLHAVITSEGAIESALSGDVVVGGPRQASLSFAGTFSGRLVRPHLICDGSILRAGDRAEPFAEAAPEALAEGLLLGLTRMGLLHNLARLSEGEPPDRTDGTAREWVTVSDLALGEEQELDGVRARPLTFAIAVAGRPVADAALWLDPETGLPRQRWQTVRFEEGEMRVVERYGRFELGGPVDPSTFDVLADLPESAPAGEPATP